MDGPAIYTHWSSQQGDDVWACYVANVVLTQRAARPLHTAAAQYIQKTSHAPANVMLMTAVRPEPAVVGVMPTMMGVLSTVAVYVSPNAWSLTMKSKVVGCALPAPGEPDGTNTSQEPGRGGTTHDSVVVVAAMIEQYSGDDAPSRTCHHNTHREGTVQRRDPRRHDAKSHLSQPSPKHKNILQEAQTVYMLMDDTAVHTAVRPST